MNLATIDVLNVVSYAAGILGILLSIYFGLDARKLAKQIRKYDWGDINTGVKYLAARVEKEFAPSLIISSSGGSVGIVANLYLTYTDRSIPLYVGLSKPRTDEFSSTPIFHSGYETDRWKVYLPGNLAEANADRVLILEDVVLSGQSMRRLIETLTAQGIPRERIKTAALFVTDFAITAGHVPDFYWYRISDTNFYLPWGRSTGRGY